MHPGFVSVAYMERTDHQKETYEIDPVNSDTATTFVGGCMATDHPSKARSTLQPLVGSLFAFEGSLMKHSLA